MTKDKKRLDIKSAVSTLRYVLLLNLGILMMSVGIYFFKSPNGFATGGVSGISILLAKLFPVISQATYMLIINVVLLILGIVILGRQCGLLTVYCSLMLSIENWIFEYFFPAFSAPYRIYPS